MPRLTTHTTLENFKSVIGKLQFATCVMSAGHCFLRRMHNATIGKTKPLSSVTLTPEIKEDLYIWQNFMMHHNGKTIISKAEVLNSTDLNFYSDSLFVGFGATFGSKFIQGTFPTHWRDLGIQYLELYPIFLMVNIFAHKVPRKHIIFHCDNEAVVQIINKQSTPIPTLMNLVRKMVLILLRHNITFKSAHIPGMENKLCDALSRQEAPLHLLEAYRMDKTPTIIPAHLLPKNFQTKSIG